MEAVKSILLADWWAFVYLAATLYVLARSRSSDTDCQIVAALFIISWGVSNVFVWTGWRIQAFDAVDYVTLCVVGLMAIGRSWRFATIAYLSAMMIWLHRQALTDGVLLAINNVLYLAQVVLLDREIAAGLHKA